MEMKAGAIAEAPMRATPEISVAVPIFNEEENIPILYERIREFDGFVGSLVGADPRQ